MSITPMNISKVSPYASGISKSLLTPCRRVGLSRKRKSSGSTTKLSEDLNSSNCSIPEQITSETTPINKKHNVIRKSKVVFDSPKETNSEGSKIMKTEHRAKKSLGKCFKKTHDAVPETNKPSIENINSDKKVKMKSNEDSSNVDKSNADEHMSFIQEGNKVDEQIDKNICKSGYDENSSSIKLNSSCDNIKPTEVLHMEHDKENISGQLTKDNVINNNNEGTSKVDDQMCDTDLIDNLQVQEEFSKLRTSDTILAEKTNTNIIKHCKIFIPKLSEEDISMLKGDSTLMHSSDDEDGAINKVRRNKRTILSDTDEDDDFHGYSKKIHQKTKVEAVKNTKDKKLSKDKKSSKDKTSSKDQKSLKKLARVSSVASMSAYEDDDDAFTSTPDREKNEKQDLIVKIKALEKIINEKKTKLENLRRASLYKSKHNIEELKSVTEQWRQGCIQGLNGLLNQLQAHGPIDMPMLLRNLQIPNETITKIFVNVR